MGSCTATTVQVFIAPKRLSLLVSRMPAETAPPARPETPPPGRLPLHGVISTPGHAGSSSHAASDGFKNLKYVT